MTKIILESICAWWLVGAISWAIELWLIEREVRGDETNRSDITVQDIVFFLLFSFMGAFITFFLICEFFMFLSQNLHPLILKIKEKTRQIAVIVVWKRSKKPLNK